MLRCCRQIFRLRNNGIMNSLISWAPLNMTARHASHAAKFAMNMSLKYARSTGSTRDADSAIRSRGYPTHNNSIRITNPEPHEQEGAAPLSCDSIPPAIPEDLVDQFSVLEAKLPQVRPSPPSSPVLSYSLSSSVAPGSSTIKSLPRQGQCISTTDTISPPHLSFTSANSEMPAQYRDPSITVEGVQGSVGSMLVDSPQSASVATLISAFHNFSPQLLRTLDVNLCSELLTLFGTLSDGGAHGYHSQCNTHNLDVFREGGYWEEVILVSRRMEEEGYIFGDRENYWSMRAYLERWKTLDSIGFRDQARVYYARMSPEAQFDPHISLPYFDVFLSSPSTPYFYTALDILCETLAAQKDLDSHYISLLWKVVLSQGNVLPFSSKSKILDLVLLRLAPQRHLVQDPVSSAVEDFAMAFASPFFPYQGLESRGLVSSWIGDCVKRTFAKELPVEERFNDLVLFAAWASPQECVSSSLLKMTSGSLEWRVVVGLAVLGRSLTDQGEASLESGEVRDVARFFSRLWERHAVVERPKGIDRTVVVAFLRIAVQMEDETLLNWSMDYILSRGLWFSPQSSEHETTQVEQLLNAFADGTFAYNNHSWARLPSLLMDLSHSPLQRIRYLRSVLSRLADRDIELAHQVYTRCLSSHIPIPLEASIHLAQRLAVHHKWDDVIPFLQDRRSNDTQLEHLLETVLRVFRNTREELTLPTFAKTVGDVLLDLYSNTLIPNQLKFPIRYFLPVMVVSRQAQQTVRLLGVLAKENPAALTPRVLLRIIHTLMRHRQHDLAVTTLELGSSLFKNKPRVVGLLRRKTLHALIGAGALKLASRIRSTTPPLTTQTTLDHLLRLPSRRHSRSFKLSLARLTSLVITSRAHGPTIVSAVQLLVQNQCFALAKKLIERSCKDLKPQDLTMVGNIYLHGPLRHWNKQNRSLMRHILRTKDFLVKRYGFMPDRTTVNIFIKAMLGWRAFMDSRMIRCLFDHLVRNGYPASERWHTANGVPFGTLPGEVTLDLSNIRQNMSFKRHIQPLYRMFIKELFLRKDARAAYRVIGILKEVEVSAKEQKAFREKARRNGIVKKQRKLALLEKATENTIENRTNK